MVQSRCNGNSGSALRVGFPQLCLNDGAGGVRQADNVTAFPDGITIGATFDKKLMYERGKAIGEELRGKGVHIWLGPSVGPLGRKPKGGRNWEGFGSDPVLQGFAARETIRGVQEQGVAATVKHFVGNEQEMYRMYNPFQKAYSSNIGEPHISIREKQHILTKDASKTIELCMSSIFGHLPKQFTLASALS